MYGVSILETPNNTDRVEVHIPIDKAVEMYNGLARYLTGGAMTITAEEEESLSDLYEVLAELTAKAREKKDVATGAQA